MTPTGEEAASQVPRWLDWGARIAVVVILLALAVLVVVEEIDTARAGFAAGVVIVCLVLLSLSLSRLAGLKSLNAFGIGLEMAQESLASAPSANLTYDDEVGREGDVGEIVDLQLLLEAKFAYVAKHLLGFDRQGHWSPFLTLGSLKYDQYMSREDAIAARHLLGLQPPALSAASEEDRRAFLAKAKPFVRNIRANIFHNVVKTVLEKDFQLTVSSRDRGGSKRPDLEVEVEGQGLVSVFPAFAGGGGYWKPERIKQRAADLAQRSERALIVVPPNASNADPRVPGVAVVRLDELVHAAAADQPFLSLLSE